MAQTPSTMINLGRRAVEFTLPDTVSGKDVSLKDVKGKNATVIMFICNHCPFVKHVNNELVQIAKDYMANDVVFIAISSNDVEHYPDDSPDKMKKVAQQLGYPFPYLYDETQEVAKAYGAACTPDFFLYDADLELVYRGQLDDSRPGNDKPVDGKDLRAAIDAILAGDPVSEDQRPSVGCNIKWKK
ncbi:MAG: thioredoxin family protein [Cyclobacteriaceae bacterium]